MTVRSVLAGLLGAALVCGLTFLNDYVLHQTYMVGNHFPVSVFGTLLIFLLINALVARYRKTWAFTGRELAVALGMTLVACCIPSQGFLAIMPTAITMPHRFENTDPGLRRARIAEELCPPGILLDVKKTVCGGTVEACRGKQVVLDAEASHVNPKDRHLTLHIFGQGGTRQVRGITDFSAATHTATVDEPWRYPPRPGDRYELRENNEEETLLPFVLGAENLSGTEERSRSLFKLVPWRAWRRPLLFWLPLVLAFWMAIMGLSLVLHRQWADHEHLPYPLSTIIATLLPSDDGALSGVFRDRRFQVTCAAVALLYVSNYAYTWFPDIWFRVPLRIELGPLIRALGWKSPHYVNWPTVYFSVIAIAYFLAGDVCFSLGLTGILYSFVFCTVLAHYGISLRNGDSGYVRNEHFLLFGAFLGTAMTVLYTGRHFYLSAAKRACGISSGDSIPASSVWGGRAFCLGAAVFVALLMSAGTPLPLAVAYAGLLFMIHAVLGRIVAETGLFFIQTGWGHSLIPTAVLIGLLGPQCVSPEIAFVLYLVGIIFCMDTRECLIPFALNSFRLLQLKHVRIARAVPFLGLALIVGLAIALPVTLYCQYRFGAYGMQYPWVTTWLPSHPGRETHTFMTLLESRGQLTESLFQPTAARWQAIRPLRYSYLAWTGAGLSAVLFLSIGRLKFRNWPLHPVMFLMFLGFSMAAFWFSFLLGWLIKRSIVRYGGTRTYGQLKPVFIGLLAGELIGALIPMVFGFIYSMCTGETPETFRVFPM